MNWIWNRATRELFTVMGICGIFLISYFLFSFTAFYMNTSAQYQEIQAKRKTNLEAISLNFEDLMSDQDNKNLLPPCDFANLAIGQDAKVKLKKLSNWALTLTKMGSINFGVLKFQNQTVFSSRGSNYTCGIDPQLEAPYQATGSVEVLTTVMLKTVEFDNFKLTIGIPMLNGKHVIQEFLDSIRIFFNESLTLALILFVFVAYYLSDLLFLYRIIGKSNWKDLLHERINSSKSKTLLRFIGSLILVSDELEFENKRLKHGFEPAYLRYIQSPEFQKKLQNVVYMELDWKDHTPYVNKFGLPAIIPIRNQINHTGRVIVSRYQGLILEAKSDMISFIIEYGDLNQNKHLAIACARDFFRALDHIDSNLDNPEIKIKYRGTMVVGDFEFEVTDHNYNLNSFVYYVSSRLAKLSKRPGHDITVLAKDTLNLEDLVSFTDTAEATLKGLGTHRFCNVETFLTIEDVLKERNYDLLTFFRSENDLITVMKFGIELITAKRFDELKHMLTQIRGFYLEEFITTNSLPDVYLNLLEHATHTNDESVLSAVSSLAKTLFAANMDNQKVTSFFRREAQTPLPRYRANLVEAYNLLTNYQDQTWNQSHYDFANNRVRGNVIIAACQDEVNPFYREQIAHFLESEDERYIASGLFVIGHLYRLFHTKNKIYFANNEWFRKIPDELNKFTQHQSVMVVQRAKEELIKIAQLG